jgi:hypothetical protein
VVEAAVLTDDDDHVLDGRMRVRVLGGGLGLGLGLVEAFGSGRESQSAGHLQNGE